MRRLCFVVFLLHVSCIYGMATKMNFNKAIDSAIIRYGLKEEPLLLTWFARAKVAYPPYEIALLGFKKEQTLQLWARNENQGWRFIHQYPLTAFSGRLGPKLREHDGQIPEGIYRLISFNPYSAHHLSMMIDYPNQFDHLQAIKDGRKNLGDNIFLHGKSSSVGCLAVGNQAIDQLFLLARRVGLHHVKVIIAPNDLRLAKPATSSFAQPRWLPELYKNISQALRPFPVSKKFS